MPYSNGVAACPHNYASHGGMCYFYQDFPVKGFIAGRTYQDTEESCGEQIWGGHRASVVLPTDFETDLLLQTLVQRFVNLPQFSCERAAYLLRGFKLHSYIPNYKAKLKLCILLNYMLEFYLIGLKTLTLLEPSMTTAATSGYPAKTTVL